MEAANFPTSKIVISLVIGGLAVLFVRQLDNLLLRQKRRRSKLARQGIRGPVPSALYGNIAEMTMIIQKQRQSAGESLVSEAKFHAWPPLVFPHFEQWRNEYGPTFLYSTGNIQMMCITDPEMVKEIGLCTSFNLGKPTYLSTERGPLLGRGILSSNGTYWAHQRKIISPVDISPTKFIVDNCKNIYLAGHETTAASASWCLMTMAAHPEWQDRAHAEVLETCGNNIPTADMLRSMKVVRKTAEHFPSLLHFPLAYWLNPVAYVVREALEDINVGNINIPKGVNVQIPIPILHQNADIWGTDAHQFKPDRFANGTTGACNIPQAYMPFGVGMRICAGQHFAMAELKVILSLILSKFSFSLSPAYQHSPVFRLLIQPEHGVRIQFQKR